MEGWEGMGDEGKVGYGWGAVKGRLNRDGEENGRLGRDREENGKLGRDRDLCKEGWERMRGCVWKGEVKGRLGKEGGMQREV